VSGGEDGERHPEEEEEEAEPKEGTSVQMESLNEGRHHRVVEWYSGTTRRNSIRHRERRAGLLQHREPPLSLSAPQLSRSSQGGYERGSSKCVTHHLLAV
jgi:hypothetical protein